MNASNIKVAVFLICEIMCVHVAYLGKKKTISSANPPNYMVPYPSYSKMEWPCIV